MTTEFLISGGGIGGAVLAELLARRGKRVLVLERNTTPPSFLRPELMWPATIELLCTLIPRPVWEDEAASPAGGIRVQRGRDDLAELSAGDMRSAGAQPWFVNPNETRELLLRRASFELRRGVESLSILRDGERVVGVRARDRSTGAESELLANVTIGDDGEHSIVRNGCGVALATHPFPVEFLCFGLDWPAGAERAVARIWLNPRGRATGVMGFGAMPFVRGRGAGLVLVRTQVFDANPDAEAAWRELASTEPLIGELVRGRALREMTRVKRSFGHAQRYGAPGAFFLGDAAHPVTPAGGQGANMAIADARVLAPLLASDPAGALREYERVRRPANERSISISRDAGRVVAMPGWLAGITFQFARLALRSKWPLKRLFRFASQSFLERG
jgi:2-polyprenyl-6-methoxyphenol hydroxylase-like FAD-dependent oxidoreductase